MSNDIIKLNAIVSDLGYNLAELAELGQDGFKVPLVITSDELAELIGASLGQWQPRSEDLLWFYALKIAVYARQLLEQSARIFEQMDDSDLAQQVQNVVKAIDEQFYPNEAALQVYRKLLHLNTHKSGGTV